MAGSKRRGSGGLDDYEAKRDFGKTSEPPPGRPADGGDGDAPRFVIQEHSARRLHWDLRLERDGVLASWALPRGVPDDPKENRLAVRTEDHPLEYLDFHGEIPAGQYGAGTMKIWDRGTYEAEKWRDDEVIATFAGERIQGRYALFQTRGKDWMIHRMDPPVDPDREPMPEVVKPMLACPSDTLPRDQSKWGFEVKWDGVRAIVHVDMGSIRIHARRLTDITARYPEVRGIARAIGAHRAILDGEIVAFDDQGRPSFERLQRRMHLQSESAIRRLSTSAPVVFMAFDLLYLDGHSTMALPYTKRRELLEALELSGPAWQTPPMHPGAGDAVLAATEQQGLEGVVAKRLDSRYEPDRRSTAWLKIKHRQTARLAVGGWVSGQGSRGGRIGALLVGCFEPDGTLRYAGRVGTGFTERELDRLKAQLEPHVRKDSPFAAGPKPPKGVTFVEPRMLVEVAFTEWTQARTLRHPIYRGEVGLSDGDELATQAACKPSR